MVASLRKLAKASIADYESRPREEWVTLHPSQVLLSVEHCTGCIVSRVGQVSIGPVGRKCFTTLRVCTLPGMGHGFKP